ncbi:Gfo/Idh/MocA family protein [Tautonia rosea]|uniref:Gfo/Idh/MocA family protein n=1 Tax=Tautonia rosea TaxID=2728037 RepID=UPI001473D92D|nr:Gfo/Idh/MocA family oxidoreductase [Tautonia rosea]
MIAAAAVSSLATGPREPRLSAQQATPTTPNDTIRHAVIGCRIRGRVHASQFGRQNGVEIAYVCDPDRVLAEELAETVEKDQGRRPMVVQDLRVIFDDSHVDTVSIATPNHWHALAAIWAMQSGKHVYVEKPVTHTVCEGRRMVQVAQKTGRLCQAGTQNRSSGALAAAAAYLRDGKLGDVTFARTIIYGQRSSIGPRGIYEVPEQIDYNLFLGPAANEPLTRPRLHYDWHWNWNTGNGELGNNNIHYIDICRWIMGLSGLGNLVLSVGGRLGYEDAGETPNTQLVVHQFETKTIVQEVRGLKTDPFSSIFQAGSIIHGTEGFLAGSSLFDPDGNLVQTFEGPSENHFVNFVEAVRNGRREELNADILEGHLSSALCHVGNLSYRLGTNRPPQEIADQLEDYGLHDEVAQTFDRMVNHLRDNEIDLDATQLTLGPLLSIDSDQERFTDSSEANVLLSREYRTPFVVPEAHEL